MAKQPDEAKKLQSRRGSKKSTRGSKKLARMRENASDDWKINDVESVCEHLGLTCSQPTRGSHYKVSSPSVGGILTVPAHNPIKAVYIKRFIAIVDAHLAQTAKGNVDE